MKITTSLRRARRYLKNSVLVLNSLFVAAFPWADQIVAGVKASMPQLVEYLPPNIYQTVGIVVTVLTVLLSARQVRAAASKEPA